MKLLSAQTARIGWGCLLFLLIAGCGGGGSGGGSTPSEAPTVVSIDLSAGPESGGTTIIVTGTAFVAPASVSIDGVAATNVVVVSDTIISCDTPAGSAGGAVDVVVSVPGGSATLVAAFTYVVAPTVTSVAPDTGPPGGGTNVTVTGSGFVTAGTSVTFNGAPATLVSVLSDTTLSCVTPAGTGTVSLSVTTAGGTSNLPAAFSYMALLEVTSAAPDSGFDVGGTLLTISGAGFTSGAAGANLVTIGGASATNVVVVDDTTLTCTVPAGSVGTKRDITIVNGNGTATLTAHFEYFNHPPVISTPNQRLDPGAAGAIDSYAPKLHRDGNTICALWSEGSISSRDVTFSRSTDGGATWSTPVKVNSNTAGASDSISASMCCDGQTVYVAFRDDRNNTGPGEKFDLYFQKSTDGGATWLSSDVRISTTTPGSKNVRSPQLCCNGQNLVVVYTDNRQSAASYRDLRVQRSTDGGSTWLTSDTNVRDTTAGSAANVEVACSGSKFYVVWRDTRNDGINTDVYLVASVDDGATWSTNNVRLNTDTAGSAAAQLPKICCVDDLVHVVWSDNRNGDQDVRYQRSTDGGSTWLGNDVLINTNTSGASRSVNPAFCCEGSQLHIVWADDRNSSGKHDIYYRGSTDGGANFDSSDVRISTDTAGAAFKSEPYISNSGGNVFVVWTDHRDGNRGDIYYTCSADTGGTWLSSDVRLNDDTAGVSYHEDPRVVCDGAKAFFVWDDRRSSLTRGDLYFVTTTP